MSKNKHTDLVCAVGAAVMVLVTLLFLGGGGVFLKAAAADLPYTEKLFSTDRVHEIDVVVEESDWGSMLENAMAEEYIPCTLVIDGEKFGSVGIRPKGNTSLSTVFSSDSDRYSFKIEFDCYNAGSSYYGLDKLCLNNAIQDNTYMKDYLCYRMMGWLGADAPLTSFVWVTVNGEDWGLYTAVEAIEDSFAQRVYGSDHGEIYKPDSVSMGGGGRGFENRRDRAEGAEQGAEPQEAAGEKLGNGQGPGAGGGPAGMGGSDDVLLVYSGDDPESYPNIFDNAVFDADSADQQRLIRSLKALNEGDVESSVNVDEVLRYFAVHNFVLNEDSYTGTIIHNYYLYEKDGLLSMIPWDYNLAFGGMGMGGMGADGATSSVNSPIDSPVSSGDISQRPMAAWIFQDSQYTEQYHQVMDEFISGFFESGEFEALIDEAAAMISPYVEKDPTAFCTYEEFQKGVETLKEFCLLRAESVRKQLEGSIPSTSQGQAEDSSGFVDASGITLSDMGSQGGGMGGKAFEGMAPGQDFGGEAPGNGEAPNGEAPGGEAPDGEMPGNGETLGNGETPNRETPDGEAPRLENGSQAPEAPEGFGGGLPGGFGETAPAGQDSGGRETWTLLGGSLVLLAAGLLFAKFYR